jgi:CubicO group peptidase (beta-lactamase class C family)
VTGIPLPSSRPSDLGVDARGLTAFLDAVDDAGVELHSLAVARRGQVVAAGWWAPYAPADSALVYSLSKSLTATAVGFLVDDGSLSLDDRVLDRLGVDPATVDARWSGVRIRHALAMTLGHSVDSVYEVREAAVRFAVQGHPDPLLAAIWSVPPDQEPGSVFAYNQPSTILLARVVEAVAGMPVSQLLAARLLEPLGLPPIPWETDPAGHEYGFSGAHVPTATVVAMAQLHLDRGRLGGKRFLSEEWVAEATRGQGPARTDGETNADWVRGYGYSFWQSQHGYRGDGAFGQFALVLPEQDTVVALTGENEDMQRVLDLVWEHVLPAVSGEGVVTGGDRAADDELVRRLATLALPTPRSVVAGPGAARFDRASASTLPESYSGLQVESTGDGWLLRLRRGSETLDIPAGDGRWVASRAAFGSGDLAVRAAAGWVDADRFSAELRLVETPHTLRLEADASTGQVDLGWRTLPMLGPDPAIFVIP